MKRNKSQANKVLIQINELFSDRKPIIRNSSYYVKIYSPKQGRNNQKNFSIKTIFPNRTFQTVLTPKQQSLSLNKVFNSKTNSRNTKIKWPKITHPKWPFSKKKEEPKEIKQNRILSSKPSYKYHNFNTIKWLGQKYSDSVKEKSIYSLLPNKGKPIIPEYESEFNKRHREMMEYLESFRGPGGREKYVNINPKYFYDNTTFKKILKLRDMFLEFDKKGNHKMIIKEIVKLFKQNNINVDINDIKELFFNNKKNKNNKDEPNNSLYLDFYQFMNFALTRDQDFRQFMRKVKIKNKKEENNKKKKIINYNGEIDEKKDNVYIPMNFNLIFNYFINKEKQRNSIIIVEKAIKEMDKIIQNGGENESDQLKNVKSPKKPKRESLKLFVPSKTLKDKNINLLNLRSFHKTKSIREEKNLSGKNSNNYFNSKSSEKMNGNINDIFKKNDNLKNINFAQLIKEFSSLFGIKDNKDEENELSVDKNMMQNSNSAKSFLFNQYNNFNNKKDKLLIKDKNEKTFTDTMKNDIKLNSLKKLNINNFEKYHDLKLAILETKEQIKKMKNTYNIDDDQKIHNLNDLKDIINQGSYINKSFKKLKPLENLENSLHRDNNYSNNINYYSKTLKIENNSKKGRKKYHIKKKPLYNFYCGIPKIMNFDNDYIKSPKLTQKYDYVPNELFNKK